MSKKNPESVGVVDAGTINPRSLVIKDNKIYGLGLDNKMYRWDTRAVEWVLYKFEENLPKEKTV